MKKTIIIVVVLLIVAGWGTRFYFVNKDTDKPIIQTFPKGVEVPVGKDFFNTSDEIIDGYTVKVLGAEIVPVKEFLRSYDAIEQLESIGTFTKYIYVVRVSFSNQSNADVGEKGIDLGGYYLQGTDYILSLESLCYRLANPKMPGESFSMREGTSMELTLPFDVIPATTSYRHLLKDPPKLLISQYPYQKMISLY